MGAGTRWGIFGLVWAVSNTFIGYCAYLPLAALWLLGEFVVGESRFGSGETKAGVFLIGVGGVVVVVAAVFVNRALCRVLGLTGRRAAAFWVVTVLVLLTPFGYELLFDRP